MALPGHILEKAELYQAEQATVSALLSSFEAKAALVGAQLRHTQDRMQHQQLNKTFGTIQKKQAGLLHKSAKLVAHARAGKVGDFDRELDRMLQSLRNIKRELAFLDGQLDEILGRIDKL